MSGCHHDLGIGQSSGRQQHELIALRGPRAGSVACACGSPPLVPRSRVGKQARLYVTASRGGGSPGR